MLTLYHAPGSVCSQKVRLGLALMDLAYDSRVLNLQAGEQFAPAYRALNADAVVPTLVDDGLVVVESSLILEYLDREYNAGRLMPQHRAGRVAAQHWLLRCLAIHAAINTLSFATALRGPIIAKSTPAEIDALVAKIPDPVMGAKRKDLIVNGLGSVYVGQALMHLRRTLDDMQTAMAQTPWMGGAAIGIADVALVAYVDRLDRLGLAGFWDDRPAIAPWLASWRATDAYATAIENHMPAASAEAMRKAGQDHWPALRQRWADL